MDDRAGLVLSVAGRGDGRQGREEQVAVGNVAPRRQGVGQDARGAGPVDVGAVRLGVARCGAAALGRHLLEHARDGRDDRRGAALEVLGQLGAGGGRGPRLGRPRRAVANGRGDGGLLGAGAVRLHGRAPLQEGGPGGLCLGAVDLDRERVAAQGNGALELGAVGMGKRHGSAGHNVKGASGAEVVHVGNVKVFLDDLASTNRLESVFVESSSRDAETDTFKADLGIC